MSYGNEHDRHMDGYVPGFRCRRMTRENRATDKTCPECENNPIIEANDSAFCDICNRYMETATLVN